MSHLSTYDSPSPPKRRLRKDGVTNRSCESASITGAPLESLLASKLRGVPQGWGRLSWIESSSSSTSSFKCDNCGHCSPKHSSGEDLSSTVELKDSPKKGSFKSLHRCLIQGRKPHLSKESLQKCPTTLRNNDSFSSLKKSCSNVDVRSVAGVSSITARLSQRNKSQANNSSVEDSPPVVPAKNSDNHAFELERPVKNKLNKLLPLTERLSFERGSSYSSKHKENSSSLLPGSTGPDQSISIVDVSNKNIQNGRVRTPDRYPPPLPRRTKNELLKSSTQPQLYNKTEASTSSNLAKTNSIDDNNSVSFKQSISDNKKTEQINSNIDKTSLPNKAVKNSSQSSHKKLSVKLLRKPSHESKKLATDPEILEYNKESKLKSKLRNSIKKSFFKKRSVCSLDESIDENCCVDTNGNGAPGVGSEKNKSSIVKSSTTDAVREVLLERNTSSVSSCSSLSSVAPHSQFDEALLRSQRRNSSSDYDCSAPLYPDDCDSSDSCTDDDLFQNIRINDIKTDDTSAQRVIECSAPSTLVNSTDTDHTAASKAKSACGDLTQSSKTSSTIIPVSSSNTAVHQPTDCPSSMSNPHGGSANYGTLRRGIMATTSRLMGASMRKPGLSPAISFDRNMGYGSTEPSRFLDGVSFKGKLIGVLEVDAARGDKMCQDALAELKGAVRAAGEHKQRIAVTVAMDGIRLRDDRTGDCLYHHPVHKISFIAQDMTDTRAFGYIFGSPDAGHKFFGIKTEKTATQVVIAMRDLFQVVFEMKKKEIEKARSQLEEGRDGADFKEDKQFDPFGDSFRPVSGSANSSGGKSGISVSSMPTASSSKVRIPSTSSAGSTSNIPPPLAPPPISGRSRHESTHSRSLPHHQQHPSDVENLEFAPKFPVDFTNVASRAGAQSVPPHDMHDDRYAVFNEIRPASDESLNDYKSSGGNFAVKSRLAQSHDTVDSMAEAHAANVFTDDWTFTELTSTASTEARSGSSYDVFTELDPLGTGKIRPFVDKKDFFNDVRQKKRLLRELGDGEDSHPGSPRTHAGVIPTEVSALVASSAMYSSSSLAYTSSEALHHTGTVSGGKSSTDGPNTSTTPMHRMAITSHSMSESYSPTHESYEDYRTLQQPNTASGGAVISSSTATAPSGELHQHFEPPNVLGFADFNRFTGESPRSQRSELSSGSLVAEEGASGGAGHIPVGPLTVALPPESFRDSPPSSPPQHSSPQNKRMLTQMSLPTAGVSPKTLPRSHKFAKQPSIEGDWDAPGIQGDTPSLEGHESTSHQYSGHDGISPRPRPRASLNKHLSASSATLPLRPSQSHFDRMYSHDQNMDELYDKQQLQKFEFDKKFDVKYNDDIGEYEHFSSPEGECGPFPNEDIDPNYSPAPIPPPRPAHIKPPPLPPKKPPTHVTLKPPPRPPVTSSSEAQYLYTNKQDPSVDDSTPPLPLPSRKPRYSEPLQSNSIVPSRANKPAFIAAGITDQFQFPRSSSSPTHEPTAASGAIPKVAACSSKDSTPSKTSTPGKSPRSGKRPSTGSIDLTNTSLDQLAAKLEIPVEQLAKMTVVELAACLAQLQLKQEERSEGSDTGRHSRASKVSSRDHSQERLEKHSSGAGVLDSVQHKFDEEEEFARFDAQFPVSPVNTPDFSIGFDKKRQLTQEKQQSLGAPNSMEDEASEVSSGTFKVNFVPPDFRQDSIDQRSSLSDDLDHDRDQQHQPTKNWRTMADKNSLDMVDMIAVRSPISQKLSIDSGKSPFTDDFSCVSQEEIAKTLNRTKSSNESLGKFDDDFIPPVMETEDRYAAFRELALLEELKQAKGSTSSKSPFDDNFIENCPKEGAGNVLDSGFLSTTEADAEKFDEVFHEDSKTKEDEEDVQEKQIESADINNITQEDNDSLNKSPFDDDFTNRSDRYEVLKEVESEREPSLDGEGGAQEDHPDNESRSKGSPFDDSWQNSDRNISFEERKVAGDETLRRDSRGRLQSPCKRSHSVRSRSSINSSFEAHVATESPTDERMAKSGRDSPYEDCISGSRDVSMEHNGEQIHSARLQRSKTAGSPTSFDGERGSGRSSFRRSIGSEGSVDLRQTRSPFDDNFSSAVGSVAEEVTFEAAFPSLHPLTDNFDDPNSLIGDPFNNKVDDVFVPESNAFADFEQAFHQQKSHSKLGKNITVTPRTPNPSFDVGDEAASFGNDAQDEVFKAPASYADSKGSESDPHDIFRRNSDPFADDFFKEDAALDNEEEDIDRVEDVESDAQQGNVSSSASWQEPFEVFKFGKSDTK